MEFECALAIEPRPEQDEFGIDGYGIEATDAKSGGYTGSPHPIHKEERVEEAAIQHKCGNLTSMHQAYIASRDALPVTEEMKDMERIILLWCAQERVIIVGGTGIDFHFRDLFEEGFYPNERAADIDAKISSDSVLPALHHLDSMVDQHPKFKLIQNRDEEPIFKHIEVTGLNIAHMKAKLGDMTLIECAIVDSELFSTIPFDFIDLNKILVSKKFPSATTTTITTTATAASSTAASSTDVSGKPTSLQLKVVKFEEAVKSYFMMTAQRRNANTTIRLRKNLAYIWRIGEALQAHKLLPPAPKRNSKMVIEKKTAAVEAILPLLEDCYYTGHTAFNIGFDVKTEMVADRSAVEIICFGKTREVLLAYMERYDYATYEIRYSWEWENIPSVIAVEPAQTSDKPPLILYDASTLCGQVNGKILSPISLAALSTADLELPILSFLVENTHEMLQCVSQEVSVGGCVSGPFIANLGARFKVLRTDYLSSKQYFVAVISAYEKMQSTRKEEHRPRVARAEPEHRDGPQKLQKPQKPQKPKSSEKE